MRKRWPGAWSPTGAFGWGSDWAVAGPLSKARTASTGKRRRKAATVIGGGDGIASRRFPRRRPRRSGLERRDARHGLPLEPFQERAAGRRDVGEALGNAGRG